MNKLRRTVALWIRTRRGFLIFCAVGFGAGMYFLSLQHLRGVSDLPSGGQIIVLGVNILLGYLWARYMWDAMSRYRIFERSPLPPLGDKE
jgi:hypothetical protein